MGDKDNWKASKSPLEQYSKIKIKKRDEIKNLIEHEKCVIVPDDILGSINSKFLDQFFIGDKHNNLDIYYLSQPTLICQREHSEV